MKPYASGDSWALYLGDCREILPALEPVDCVVTDPPYSDRTHEGARSGANIVGDPSRLCDRTPIDFDPTTAEGLRHTFGLLRFRRWLVSFMDYRMVPTLEDRPPENMRGVRMGIWVKHNAAPQFTGDRPGMGWEAIWIAHAHREKGVRMRWNGGGHHAVWAYNTEQGPHPTMKPLPLVKRLVTLFSDEGDTILDPFAGSGTTLLAARDLGRKSMGIELKEEYAEIAAQRLSQNLLPFGEGKVAP